MPKIGKRKCVYTYKKYRKKIKMADQDQVVPVLVSINHRGQVYNKDIRLRANNVYVLPNASPGNELVTTISSIECWNKYNNYLTFALDGFLFLSMALSRQLHMRKLFS